MGEYRTESQREGRSVAAPALEEMEENEKERASLASFMVAGLRYESSGGDVTKGLNFIPSFSPPPARPARAARRISLRWLSQNSALGSRFSVRRQ